MLFEHSPVPKGPGPPGGCGKARGEKAHPELIFFPTQSPWCPASGSVALVKEKAAARYSLQGRGSGLPRNRDQRRYKDALPPLLWRGCSHYLSVMRAPKKKPTAAKLRNWRVSIMRHRAEYLGTVAAANAEAAEALAAETFKLDGERRKRLAIREDG